MDSIRLDGKTVIVTGSNTGIGKETAKCIAAKGAKVILACRSEERTEPARQEIIAETGNNQVYFRKLDLSSLKSVRNFAEQFNAEEDKLDILINNAGVITMSRKTTEDGFELIFGVNHLGHFLLTNLLLDKLKSSAPSRIVNVSSLAHEKNKVKFDDLQSERSFSSMAVYGQSKSCNILFTVKLAEILEGTGVTAYSLHPGFVKTELGREMPCCSCCMPCILRIASCFMCLPLIDTDEGAMTSLYCALEPSIGTHSGRYYSDSKETPAKPHATNPEDAERLWVISEELSGLK